MKYLEVKVVFDNPDSTLGFEPVADLFHDLGLQGVIIEDPELSPVEGWGDDAIDRPEDCAVTGYFPLNRKTEMKCRLLRERLKKLHVKNNIKTKILCRHVDEEDWAESWKEFFWPEKITGNIVIKPTWRKYHKNRDELIIEIDPGMAFGTGTHPTTAMCIRMIEKFIQPCSSFLDIGTGSGILMITAAKLGAEKIVGIDMDEVAVKVAEKNLFINKVDPANFRLIQGNLADTIEDRFDLIVANILAEVVLVLLEDIKRLLSPKGMFICSGISTENCNRVLMKLNKLGFQVIENIQQDNWVAIISK